ncbi:PDZ domain-containing protein [Deminuibacter soli]|uniref:PDZ domain-containing protein n=2 Tax=Deminuibacter soli TaxID=2291815 RepID=A0A3E1NRS5_9BACT|nr:PDZ domain-containing protein [Deminuibacter soli]
MAVLLPAVLACCMLHSLTLRAQEQFIAPSAKLLTSFPFKMLTGGIIIVTATLDDHADSLNFVLDTGSGGISLDSATVDYLKLKRTPSARTIRGIAGVRTVEFTYNHSLHLPGLTSDSLDFHINDYDLLSSVYGIRIDGIMGYSFLRRYIVAVDYDKMMLNIFTPGSYNYPRNGYFLHPIFSNLPMQRLDVKDAKTVSSRYYLDTGAGLCMLFSQNFMDDSAWLNKKRKLYPTQAEGLGGKKNMSLTVIKEVKLGPYRFKKVPVYVFDDEYNVTSYPVLAGLIGNDIMRRFNVVLNYPDQLIYIKPNTHYNDVFDYSYTGLGMYVIDGSVHVIDIITGSPADKAGFQKNDIIVGVGNNLSNDIQAYKNLLQITNTRVTVVVLRQGKLVQLRMNIKSILRGR